MSVMKQNAALRFHFYYALPLIPRLRLRTRNTDDADEIAKRLRNARAEIARHVHYEYALSMMI